MTAGGVGDVGRGGDGDRVGDGDPHTDGEGTQLGAQYPCVVQAPQEGLALIMRDSCCDLVAATRTIHIAAMPSPSVPSGHADPATHPAP